MRLLHACPPSCKHLRVDGTESGRALERHRALEIVDGGIPALKPRSTRPRTVRRRRGPPRLLPRGPHQANPPQDICCRS